MQKLLAKLDDLAAIKSTNSLTKWLERIAFIFLFLMVLSAPHSIAATQTAWLSGMLAWIIRLFIKPRPRLARTPLDIALWTFFGWTILTCFFSYEPLVSINKLRGAALFLIFYFVINNLRNLRALKFLVFTLIFSCMVNVLWTPIERIFGRGIEIHGIGTESPLKKALLFEGDTLLKANGKKMTAPEDFVAEIERNELTKVEFYRPDFYFTVEVKRADLLNGNALEKLGIESWKKSRNWRSQGFYGHYVTYAEVLQLIISLVFGLFIAGLISPTSKVKKFLPFSFSPILFFCLAAMAFALLLTITRSSQLAFLVSALTIVLLNGNRKILLTLAVLSLPVALIGLYVLQQSRQVGFFDQKDESTTYRETVYREGLNLWTQNPRHFFVGIGMDTTTKKEYIEKWRLFGDGKLPLSHFHSTPIQLLVERGLFGLLFWLFVLGTYFKTLWKGLQKEKMRKREDEIFEVSSFKGKSNLIAENHLSNTKDQLSNTDNLLSDTKQQQSNTKKQLSNTENLLSNTKNLLSNTKKQPSNTKNQLSSTENEIRKPLFSPFSAFLSISSLIFFFPSFQFRRGIILGCFGGAVGFFTSSIVQYNLGDGEVAMMFFC